MIFRVGKRFWRPGDNIIRHTLESVANSGAQDPHTLAPILLPLPPVEETKQRFFWPLRSYQNYLTDEEEKMLEEEILLQTEKSYCLSYQQIIQRVTDIVLAKRGKLKGNADTISYHWLRLFLDRHPALKKTKAQVLQARRAKALNAEAIKDYFIFLKDLMGAKKFKSVWSADESGFSQRELDKYNTMVFLAHHAQNTLAVPCSLLSCLVDVACLGRWGGKFQWERGYA